MPKWERMHWGYVAWFSLVHASLPLAVLYWNVHEISILGITSVFSWWSVLCAFGLFFFCHIGITCGAHRLFTHASYKTTALVQWVWILAFAGTFQSTLTWWVGTHRRHHAHEDTEKDPHNINRGFWWAHCGWILEKGAFNPPEEEFVVHLTRNHAMYSRVLLHDKYQLLFAVIVGLGFPVVLCGVLWGDLLGGLLIGGFVRLTAQYHTTWMANSWSHMFGTQRFKGGTATSNFILGLLLNTGEAAQHDYHHAVPNDWRIEPYISRYNPGTWVLWMLQQFGLVWDCKEASAEVVRIKTHPEYR